MINLAKNDNDEAQVLALEMRGFWASGVAPIPAQPEASRPVVKVHHVPYMFY